MTNALAVFVKTPGFSPIKTRLANEIGVTRALEFYLAAIKTLEVRLKEFTLKAKQFGYKTDLYWAVAEQVALTSPHWEQFPKIPQGSGSLNDRLFRVYDSLLTQYDSVTLIGADCPHLQLDDYLASLTSLQDSFFSLGTSQDGGFYLLSGKRPIALSDWHSIPMSTNQTGNHTYKALSKIGKTDRLNESFDVDTLSDLLMLQKFIERAPSEYPHLVQYFSNPSIP